MSLDTILWAMKDAPTANVEEWAVLSAMAESADEDGCNAFQSTDTIAERTKVSKRTVQRRIDDMLERGLIGIGDQTYWKLLRIPKRYRPVNYDLLIPYAWYGNIERVQSFRADNDRPPLTKAERPNLGPPPERKRRKDAKTKDDPREDATVTELASHAGRPPVDRGDYKSPLVRDDSQSPLETDRDDSQSPLEHGRGDYQSRSGVTTSHVQGRQEVTQPSPITLPKEPTPHPYPSLRSGESATEPFELVIADAGPAPKPTFEDFYAAFPKAAARGDAEKAWHAAIRKGVDPVLMLEGARRYAADPNLPTGPEARYIKSAGPWIRAQCWLDAPLPPRLNRVREQYDDQKNWGTPEERAARRASLPAMTPEEIEAEIEAEIARASRSTRPPVAGG